MSITGVILGITTVIVLLAIGQGVKGQVLDMIGGMGSNVVIVRPGSESPEPKGLAEEITALEAWQINLTSSSLSLNDATALQKDTGLMVAPDSEASSIRVSKGANLSLSISAIAVGTTPEFPTVRSWGTSAGRFFSGVDQEAVVGKTIVKELFNGDEQQAIGNQVTLAARLFTIVGVMESTGVTLIKDLDAQVIIPIQQFHQLFGGAEGQKVSMLLVKAPNSEALQQTKERVRDVLVALHGGLEDFNVATQDELSGTLSQLNSTLNSLFIGSSVIGLAESALSIGIIMYISVQQRRREIGIRAAAGASPTLILSQFVTEGVLIALIGGVIGVPLGVLLTTAVHNFSPLKAELTPYIIMLAFGVTLVVGVVGSLFPAWLASRVEPVEAMRNE